MSSSLRNAVEIEGDSRNYHVVLPHRETDAIQRHLAGTHEPYEHAMLRAASAQIESNSRVLDVGANVGNHSLYFATQNECDVVAYEPNDELCDALEASAEANHITDRVIVRRVGVGSHETRARFRESIPSNLGAQSLVEDDEGGFQVVTIDHDLPPGPRVSVMKIDVEGMEVDVIRGAEETIRRDRPVLFVECAELDDFRNVYSLLAGFGYGPVASYNATPTHEFRPLALAEERELCERIAVLIAERYEVSSKHDRALSRLEEANAKYRGVTATLAGLRDDLARAVKRARNAEAGFARVRDEALRAGSERDAARSRAQILQTAAAKSQANTTLLTKQLRAARQLAVVRQNELRTLKKRKLVRAAAVLTRARRRAKAIFRPAVRALPTRDLAAATIAATRPFARTSLLDSSTEPRFSPENLARSADRARRSASRFVSRVSGQPPRIAAVTDEFTANGFSPETEFLNLTRETWRSQIESFVPDLLFVESAWRGAGGTWHNVLPAIPEEITDLLAWCEEHRIPTVFWNKEDPVHFETFLPLAARFDYVFTTDLDRVPLYMRELGHNRVGLLPFASQPRVHHPVQTGERMRALMFAGGYYRRYPERMRDLAAAISGASDVMPIEIFDRQYGTTLVDYAFPDDLQRFVVGTLGADEIDEAYKGYELALNLNSVKDSTTMFARRVFELAMSGTATISNYARGLHVIFGDLVPSSDSADGIRSRIQRLDNDDDYRDRLRSLSLRKVLREHTYAERLRMVTAFVEASTYTPSVPPTVAVISPRSQEGWQRLTTVVTSQVNVAVLPIVVTDDQVIALDAVARGWTTLTLQDAQATPLEDMLVRGPIAVLDERHGYGDAYLESLVCATKYSTAEWLSKIDRFVARDNAVERVDEQRLFTAESYTRVTPSRSMVTSSSGREIAIADLLSETLVLNDEVTLLAVDPFDFCEDGAGVAAQRFSAAQPALDEGAGIAELNDVAAGYADTYRPVTRPTVVAPADLPRQSPADSGISIVRRGYGTLHVSRFEEGPSQTLWCAGRIAVEAAANAGSLPLRLDAYGTLRTRLIVRWFNAQGQPLSWESVFANVNHTVAIPEGAVSFRLGLRVDGTGTVTVRSIALAHSEPVATVPVRSADTLLVADAYPSYDNLYRYGFVHSRVREYRARGFDVDVFRFQRADGRTYYEFEDVQVLSGPAETLRAELASGRYSRVLIHFLSEEIWDIVEPFAEHIDITVWVHGAEIQPWWRRPHPSDEALARAKAITEVRMAFWRRLIDGLPNRTTLVFVSEHFRKQVEEDLQRALPPSRSAIIHNPIDTDTFGYSEKTAATRLRVLSIRPYVSPVYANDLAVETVQRLSAESWFGELEFLFVGDGPLFDETLAPLREFGNVEIRRGYLRQAEIAALHREFGVFLVPTRADTHGVSRDEAMASGLVPVTSAAGAVPEFVSDAEGYIAPLNDVDGLAEAIRDMYSDPEGFLRRSAASAARVRNQAGAHRVLPLEIALATRTREGSAVD